jgi:signal transduction histidine kinase
MFESSRPRVGSAQRNDGLPDMQPSIRSFSAEELAGFVSHELRTPLMIIKGELHNLRRESGSASITESLTDIGQEVARLDGLVAQVLDLVKLIRYIFLPTDINGLCEACAAVATDVSGGRTITLSLAPDIAPIITDPNRLRMAILSALMTTEHWIRASKTGSPLPGLHPIELHTERGKDDGVSIVVRVPGVEIGPSELGQLFDDHFNRKRPGRGLGLPLVRYLVTGLEGAVGAAAETGRGIDVRLDLPPRPSLAAMTSGLWPECAKCVTLAYCVNEAGSAGLSKGGEPRPRSAAAAQPPLDAD